MLKWYTLLEKKEPRATTNGAAETHKISSIFSSDKLHLEMEPMSTLIQPLLEWSSIRTSLEHQRKLHLRSGSYPSLFLVLIWRSIYKRSFNFSSYRKEPDMPLIFGANFGHTWERSLSSPTFLEPIPGTHGKGAYHTPHFWSQLQAHLGMEL